MPFISHTYHLLTYLATKDLFCIFSLTKDAKDDLPSFEAGSVLDLLEAFTHLGVQASSCFVKNVRNVKYFKNVKNGFLGGFPPSPTVLVKTKLNQKPVINVQMITVKSSKTGVNILTPKKFRISPDCTFSESTLSRSGSNSAIAPLCVTTPATENYLYIII